MDVKRKADDTKETIHLGSLLELCYLEGPELSEGSEGWNYKGRVVFLGDRDKDQHGSAAVFEALAPSPT